MKKITQIVGVSASLILTLSLTGCYYDEVLDIEIPPTGNVSYRTDIQPIFNAQCVVCHDGTLNPDLREGTSYNFITITDPSMVVPNDADGSELYQRLIGVGNLMPPSSALPNTTISLVRDWINQGAFNN